MAMWEEGVGEEERREGKQLKRSTSHTDTNSSQLYSVLSVVFIAYFGACDSKKQTLQL